MTIFFSQLSLARFFITLLLILQISNSSSNEINLPDIGDPSGTVITPEEERQLGENLLRWLRQNHLVVEDPLVLNYIETLGYKLVASSDHQNQAFKFFVIADQTLNAFAAPGGFIGVNSGLIQAAQSESELAAVLAHEIAHITQRHMARAFDAARRQSLATTAAILAALLLGQSSSDLAKAAITTGMAANAQMQINFTRGNEEEADRLGIQALANTGYDPEGMASFFERMEKAARLYGPQLPEFLSTHPVSVSRIADSRNRARQYKVTKQTEGLNFFLIKTRLQVLAEDNPSILEQKFSANLKSGSYLNKDAEQYGLVLSLLDLGRHREAEKTLQPLLKKNPQRIAYILASARTRMSLGKTKHALLIYEKALKAYPYNHALSIYYVNNLIEANQLKRARVYLQSYFKHQQSDPGMHKLYARVAGKAGFPAEMREHLAEYYFLNGQTNTAIEQLRQATLIKNLNFYQSSRIEARIQQLENQKLKEEQP